VTLTTFKFKPHRTLNLLKIIGKADATQLRFLSFCHCLGNAKTNQQMQLARGASTSIATADKRKITKDSLIVVLAYNQRRFYVFSHVDPMKGAEQAKNINQDIWNEAPTAQYQLLASEGNAAGGAAQVTAYSKAILRTTMLHPCDVFGDRFYERLEVLLEIIKGKTLVAVVHVINIFRITIRRNFPENDIRSKGFLC
jgi:hypothetical protein